MKKVFVLILFAIPIIATLWVGNWIHTFLATSGLTPAGIYSTIKSSSIPTTQPQNFLILGLDKRNDELENTLLTDSLLLVSYRPDEATATLVPLPRDLWLPELKTKINALYYYRGPDGTLSYISQLIGQPLSHFVIIDYQLLPQIIDQLGGVDLVVRNSFTDPQFPNPPSPDYITVSFWAGPAHMDGPTALQFMRSRHSPDPVEGTDEARSARQLLVLQALVQKLSDYRLYLDPAALGSLYRFYHQSLQTNLTDPELLGLARATFPRRRFTLQPVSLQPLLSHPPVSKYSGQWVWELADPTSAQLKSFITQAFNSPQPPSSPKPASYSSPPPVKPTPKP